MAGRRGLELERVGARRESTGQVKVPRPKEVELGIDEVPHGAVGTQRRVPQKTRELGVLNRGDREFPEAGAITAGLPERHRQLAIVLALL